MPFAYENAAARFAVGTKGQLYMIYGRNPNPDLSGYGEIYTQISIDGGRPGASPRS